MNPIHHVPHSMYLCRAEDEAVTVDATTGTITYGEINTFDDWHLVPWDDRPIFQLPEVKTNYLELKGADGFIDLSEPFRHSYRHSPAEGSGYYDWKINTYPVFGAREGSIEFRVLNDYLSWSGTLSTIAQYIHGRKLKIILEDDLSYYYVGRLSINEWASEPTWSKLVLDYYLEPYKNEILTCDQEWLWDLFNFETGMIREYGGHLSSQAGALTVNHTEAHNFSLVKIYGGRKIVVPTFIVNPTSPNPVTNRDSMLISIEKDKDTMPLINNQVGYNIDPLLCKELYAGTTTDPELILTEGWNYWYIHGIGTITIQFRGGWL